MTTDPPRALVIKRVLVVDKTEHGEVIGQYRCPRCSNEVPASQLKDAEYMPCNGFYVRVIVRNTYVIDEQVLA